MYPSVCNYFCCKQKVHVCINEVKNNSILLVCSLCNEMTSKLLRGWYTLLTGTVDQYLVFGHNYQNQMLKVAHSIKQALTECNAFLNARPSSVQVTT